MRIIPAIDLQGGKCVRLKQGQFDSPIIYSSTPVKLAKYYAALGAKHLHIVDLDGAKCGNIQQLNLIQSLQLSGVSMQVGGGIRNMATANDCLSSGVSKLVIGSMAISNPRLTLRMIKKLNANNIVLALDIRMHAGIPKVAIHGWQMATKRMMWDVIPFYQAAGVTTVLCTDIDRDGCLKGPNFTLYDEAVHRFPMVSWQASGGIRNIHDIRVLSTLGISSVILGRVLYESDFNLPECLEAFASC